MTGCPANNSPVARALGDDFINLHTAVRKHYYKPTVVLSGVMNSINVKTAIRPVALLSYMLFRAPVPHNGEDVERESPRRGGRYLEKRAGGSCLPERSEGSGEAGAFHRDRCTSAPRSKRLSLTKPPLGRLRGQNP